MKKTPLQIHCVFKPTGDDLRRLVLRSFSLYMRHVLAEQGEWGV